MHTCLAQNPSEFKRCLCPTEHEAQRLSDDNIYAIVKMPAAKLTVVTKDNAGHETTHILRTEIPKPLLPALSEDAEHTPDNQQRVCNYIEYLGSKYKADILACKPFQCVACGKRATTMVDNFAVIPDLDEPEITSHWIPVCAREWCGLQAERQGQEGKQLNLQKSQGSMTDLNPCTVCGATQGTSHCGGCRVSVYCSARCQRMDWPSHKRSCKAFVQKGQSA